MKLIVLDRDGVINEDSDEYIKSVDEWIPIPGSMEAIARLNRGGFRVVVATNQSGISRGMFDLETLSAMHKKMHELAGVAGGHIEETHWPGTTPAVQIAIYSDATGDVNANLDGPVAWTDRHPGTITQVAVLRDHNRPAERISSHDAVRADARDPCVAR